jgi:hypothetical protein
MRASDGSIGVRPCTAAAVEGRQLVRCRPYLGTRRSDAALQGGERADDHAAKGAALSASVLGVAAAKRVGDLVCVRCRVASHVRLHPR